MKPGDIICCTWDREMDWWKGIYLGKNKRFLYFYIISCSSVYSFKNKIKTWGDGVIAIRSNIKILNDNKKIFK